MPATSLSQSSRRVARIVGCFRLAYEYLVLYGGLVLFGVSIFTWSLAAVVLHAVLPRRLGARVGQFVIMALFRAFLGVLQASGIVKCDLRALDALRNDRALIIAANHPSLLDAVLVVSRLPGVVCIMKAGIRDNLILGGGARFAGYIRANSRFAMIRSAARAAHAGSQLLVFPEGTRTRKGAVNDFKGGFALIAKTARVPVQTVFIETDSPFLGKGWPLYRKPVFPLIYRARLGKRFEAGEDLKEFVAEMEAYYRRGLGPASAARVQSDR